jgi:hypothetical protein
VRLSSIAALDWAGTPHVQAQQEALVVHDRREDARVQPAMHLLVDGVPAREVVGQHAPLCAAA